MTDVIRVAVTGAAGQVGYAMLGRLAELERLADVLNFSKGRMSEKIGEFQEKHEFNRIVGSFGSSYSSGGHAGLARQFGDPSEFSELEMDRYDDYNILSRSLTEISADVTEVLTQLDGFVRRVDSDIDEFTKLAHRLQDEITQARMVPIGNLYTRISRTVRDAAKAAGQVHRVGDRYLSTNRESGIKVPSFRRKPESSVFRCASPKRNKALDSGFRRNDKLKKLARRDLSKFRSSAAHSQ